MSQLAKAQQAIGAGDFKSARSLLNHHLQHRPEDPDGLYLLGICEQAGNQPDAARALYARILVHTPGHFGANYNMGLLLSGAGRDQEALPFHDAAVRLQPGQFWAYVNRGNARARLRQYAAAIDDFQHALTLQKDSPEVHTNLGNALREAGRLDEALAAHEQALRLRSGFVDALVNRTAVLLALKRPEDALKSADEALRHTQVSALAWSARGAALLALKQRPESLLCYEHAVQLAPDFAEAWHHRGNVLAEMNRKQEALASYDRALELAPGNASSWFYRGMTLVELKDYPEALRSYETALGIAPELDRLVGAYLRLKTSICDWSELDAWRNRLIEGLRQGRSAGMPLGIAAIVDDPAILLDAARIFTNQQHPASARLGAPAARSRDGSKIKLGYYSADFRTHPVALLLAELIERHDRSRFELVGFTFQPNPGDAMTERLQRAFDSFIEIRDRSDLEVAQLSRDMGIDIAINLGGYTDGHRSDIFALRAAPVQVNYLGYPGTMGASYMDYVISDGVASPDGQDIYYDEKIARLPSSFMPRDTTQQIADARFLRADFGLPEDGFVYCCFNNHFKITPHIFDVWMRLLKQTPGSVLWLSDANDLIKANLAREAVARGVTPDRIVYARRVDSMAEHLARYRLADLFVDTMPYNAHTTASDALWAGVPVLTYAGKTFASRVAASLLHAAGLAELVTDSMAAYEALALELARHPARLSALRQKLDEQRLTHALFSSAQLARDMEQLFGVMHERRLDGLPPAPIDLSARPEPSL